jgi:hypothetical protein
MIVFTKLKCFLLKKRPKNDCLDFYPKNGNFNGCHAVNILFNNICKNKNTFVQYLNTATMF